MKTVSGYEVNTFSDVKPVICNTDMSCQYVNFMQEHSERIYSFTV